MSDLPASSPVDGRDPEVFARLWARVSRPEATPIIPNSAPAGTAGATPALPAARPEGRSPAHAEPQGRELEEVPCLGRASAVHVAQLQGQIAEELETTRFYQALSHRVPAALAPTLAALAAQELRHAKRLGAACFLISGVRYWPDRRTAVPRGAWMALLRQAFAAEQQTAAAYCASAEETLDPALGALYRELAGDEARHAGVLLDLFERL